MLWTVFNAKALVLREKGKKIIYVCLRNKIIYADRNNFQAAEESTTVKGQRKEANVLRIAFCYPCQAANLQVGNFTLQISSHNYFTQAKSMYIYNVPVKTAHKKGKTTQTSHAICVKGTPQEWTIVW